MSVLLKIDGVSKPAIQFLHKHTWELMPDPILYRRIEGDAALIYAQHVSMIRGRNAYLLQVCHLLLKSSKLFTHV